MARKLVKYGYEWDDAAELQSSPRLLSPINFALAGVSLAMSYLAAVSFDREIAMLIASFGIAPRTAQTLAYATIVVPVAVTIFMTLRLFGMADRDED